jgi:hypothetical protein
MRAALVVRKLLPKFVPTGSSISRTYLSKPRNPHVTLKLKMELLMVGQSSRYRLPEPNLGSLNPDPRCATLPNSLMQAPQKPGLQWYESLRSAHSDRRSTEPVPYVRVLRAPETNRACYRIKSGSLRRIWPPDELKTLYRGRASHRITISACLFHAAA